MSSKKRESNIELLRIISMLFIILFHYVFNSSFVFNELSINNLLIETGWFLGELGVNLFILITGYYLCKSRFSIKKIVLIVCEVFFYNLINVIIGIKIGYIEMFSGISQIFPIITEKYWFITAYLLIYMLSPYFNRLIKSFEKNEYQKFLLTVLTFWCIIPTIFGFFYNTSETLLFYNRFIWLIIVYFMGAYIRIYNIKFLSSKKRSLITCTITFLIMVISIVFIYNFKDYFFRIGTTQMSYFWTPNNILMLILSISFFMLFTKIQINSNRLINSMASTTLGIYLLHDGVIKKYVWKNWFKSDIYIYTDIWYMHLIFSTILIFFIGFTIDVIRQFIEKYTIKRIVDLNMWPNIYREIKEEGKKIMDKFI